MTLQTPDQALQGMAARHPDLLAIVTDSTTLTYARLDTLVTAFAARMARLGVGQGTVVALDSSDLLVVAPVILGCARLGASWISAANARLLPAHLAPAITLTGRDEGGQDGAGQVGAGQVGAGQVGAVRIDTSWAQPDATPTADAPSLPRTQADLDRPFVFAPTSGTTGAPKLLALSLRQQIGRSAATRDDFRERETVFCSLFSANAYPCITRFLSAFTNGATVVQSRDPALWDMAGLTHLYGSVAQVAEFMAATRLPRRFPLIHVSGAKLSDGLARQLMASFDTVVDLYASTETNRSFKNIRFIDPDGQIALRGERLDSEVQIVDPDGTILPDGQTGLVRVRNGYMATGYLDNPEATAASFRDGWFYTGDLGQFGPNGELRIAGRSGDVLNLGGIKVNAAAIDDQLLTLTGVADAMCFDVPVPHGPNELLAFVVPQAGVSLHEIRARFVATLLPGLDPARAPRRLIEVSQVPRAHDGGARRFLCRDLYLRQRGTLPKANDAAISPDPSL